MKIAAVICELNPMHNGHEYIFKKAREIASSACECNENPCVVAIMSGNFTQRSEPAIYDKYTRAKAAVECNAADIVIELPMPWCISSAEFFAAAGVKIAVDLKADFLVFGSECGNAELLGRSAEILDSKEYTNLYKSIEKENKALGSAAIKELTLTKLSGEAALTTPNDILGIEYMRAVKKYANGPSCMPVKRIHSATVKSASELRKIITTHGCIDTTKILEYMNRKVTDTLRLAQTSKVGPINYNKFGDTIFRYIRLSDPDSYRYIAESGGGLLERIINSAKKATSYEDFIQLTKTKKYTDSRIRRVQLYSILNVRKEDLMRMPKFTFLLAANDVGAEFIRLSKITPCLPIISKPSTVKNLNKESGRQASINAIADNLYALSMPKVREAGYFLRCTPYINRHLREL